MVVVLISVVVGGWPDLAAKDAIADYRVDQHQREYEETLAPEHEGEAGMGCGGFLNGDRERNHVGPERDRQGAERSRENQSDHVERHSIPATPNARGRRSEERRVGKECRSRWSPYK